MAGAVGNVGGVQGAGTSRTSVPARAVGRMAPAMAPLSLPLSPVRPAAALQSPSAPLQRSPPAQLALADSSPGWALTAPWPGMGSVFLARPIQLLVLTLGRFFGRVNRRAAALHSGGELPAYAMIAAGGFPAPYRPLPPPELLEA